MASSLLGGVGLEGLDSFSTAELSVELLGQDEDCESVAGFACSCLMAIGACEGGIGPLMPVMGHTPRTGIVSSIATSASETSFEHKSSPVGTASIRQNEKERNAKKKKKKKKKPNEKRRLKKKKKKKI
jgi:hypothetical protein